MGVHVFLMVGLVTASDPLHVRIDASITAGNLGVPVQLATDAEFLRRVYLDLHGTVPSTSQLRAFLEDPAKDKRSQVIDQLLAHPRFSRFMATTFDVMMMERQADKHVKTPEWQAYLYESFLARKNLDQLAREILSADGVDPKLRPAVRFYLDREGEPNRLTRDVGRIFFGMDLQCAQCHDHPLIDDYYQEDYYGIFAFLNRSFLFTAKDKKVFFAEKAEGNVSFTSVFTKESGESGPCLPEVMPIQEPTFKKGEEYKVKPAKDVRPIPKYSRRQQLAVLATSGENRAFNRNLANRLWAHMMGQGLVEPVDLYHSDNPPLNPELMEQLAAELVRMKFDIRSYLRELALSKTYQRSLDLPGELTITSDQLASQVAAMEADHAKRVAASQSLTAAIEKSRKERLQQKEQLAPVTKQRTDLVKPLEELRKKNVPAQKAAADSKQLLVDKQKRLQVIAAAMTATKTALAALPKEMVLEQALAIFGGRMKKLQGEVAAAEKDHATKNATAVALAKQLGEKEALAADLDARVRTFQDRILQLTVEMRTSRFAYQRENEQITLIVNRISDLKQLAAYAELERSAERSRQALARAESQFKLMHGKVVTLSRDFKNNQQKLETARSMNREAKKQVSRLDQRQVALQQLTKSLPGILRNVELSAKAITGDEEIGKLQQALAQRLGQLPAEVERVGNELKAVAETVSVSAQQMAEWQPRVEALRKELTEANSQEANAKQEREAALVAARKDEEKRAAVGEEMLAAWERRFAAGSLKPMTPEQMSWSIMQALGVVDKQRLASAAELEKKTPMTEADKKDLAKVRAREQQLEAAVDAKLKGHVAAFVKLFGAGAGQPQGDFFATVDQALFMANGGLIRGWVAPSGGSLSQRLVKQTDASKFADELYMSILSRFPTDEERDQVTVYLKDRGQERPQAVQEMVWALLTSVEFRFNH